MEVHKLVYNHCVHNCGVAIAYVRLPQIQTTETDTDTSTNTNGTKRTTMVQKVIQTDT